jgi:hypothetical protein
LVPNILIVDVADQAVAYPEGVVLHVDDQDVRHQPRDLGRVDICTPRYAAVAAALALPVEKQLPDLAALDLIYMLDLVHLAPVAQWPARRAFADCHIRWHGDDQGISAGAGRARRPRAVARPLRRPGPQDHSISVVFQGEETLELFDCRAQ